MLENISKQDEYCMECEYNKERGFEFEPHNANFNDEELYYTPYCFLREQEIMKTVGGRKIGNRKHLIMSNFNHEKFQYPSNCPFALERLVR